MRLQPPQPCAIGSVIVAIPVKDEEERLARCLGALAGQRGARADAVILVVNNTRDRSAEVARSLASALPFTLHVCEHDFPPEIAGAGQARRSAMERAAAMAGEHAALLTTDADGWVAPDWIARNLAHIRAGIEAVAGRAELDAAEALLIPARLHEDDARECTYAAVLDEIAALLDPNPWDPWPRHAEHSGASICVTLDAYRRAGGMPASRLGEDRAFFAALRRTDARIRHAPDVRVTVSGRIQGRAPGGMADTIRRRLERPDAWLDDALEPVANAVRRASLRHRAHLAWKAGGRLREAAPNLAGELGLSSGATVAALRKPFFGECWDIFEECCDVLRRVPVAVADLPNEMARALRERDALRARVGGGSLPSELAAATPA